MTVLLLNLRLRIKDLVVCNQVTTVSSHLQHSNTAVLKHSPCSIYNSFSVIIQNFKNNRNFLILQSEHLPSGQDIPCHTWKSLKICVHKIESKNLNRWVLALCVMCLLIFYQAQRITKPAHARTCVAPL